MLIGAMLCKKRGRVEPAGSERDASVEDDVAVSISYTS